MPCSSEHLEATSREVESRRVLLLLQECGFTTGKFDAYYGRPKTLDEDTRILCDYLKGISSDAVKEYSLELQIWWRDHQRADAKREHTLAVKADEDRRRQEALNKLTAADKKILGL